MVSLPLREDGRGSIMLKAQIAGKISQLDPGWREIEDLLTGDFFGVLDYLPREPFLRAFVSSLHPMDRGGTRVPLDGVDWEGVEVLFWRMTHAGDETAEPDVIIVSNRWVLVIEVKLASELGPEQPWREYCVGKAIAEDRGLPPGSVYYLLVARRRLSIRATFRPSQAAEREELLSRSLEFRWCRAVAMVRSWLNGDIDGPPMMPEHTRMLGDLMSALRKRRTLFFAGFAFENPRQVDRHLGAFFCPPRMDGFLTRALPVGGRRDGCVFLRRFGGFLRHVPRVERHEGAGPLARGFDGFLSHSLGVGALRGPVFLRRSFAGFLVSAPRCGRGGTLWS